MEILITPEDVGYSAAILTLHIYTQGDSFDELLHNIHEGLELYYEGRDDRGDKLEKDNIYKQINTIKFYHELKELAQKSAKDIEKHLTNKSTNDIEIYLNKSAKTRDISVFQKDTYITEQESILNLEVVLGENESDEMKDAISTTQESISDSEMVLQKKASDEMKKASDEMKDAISHIIKSINTKYFGIIESVAKILQPTPKVQYVNSDKIYDQRLTDMLFGVPRFQRTDDHRQHIYLDKKDYHDNQIVCMNLNIFYRESFSIIELLDVLAGVMKPKDGLTLEDIKKFSSSSITKYGYRDGNFQRIDIKAENIAKIFTIKKVIEGQNWSFANIRNAIAHRLDYRSIRDIEIERYEKQHQTIYGELVTIQEQTKDMKEIYDRSNPDWDLIHRLLCAIKKNPNENVKKFKKDIEERHLGILGKITDFKDLQVIDTIIDDISNIYTFLYHFGQIIKQIHEDKGLTSILKLQE